jgi:hypothetical protein
MNLFTSHNRSPTATIAMMTVVSGIFLFSDQSSIHIQGKDLKLRALALNWHGSPGQLQMLAEQMQLST